MSLWRLSSSLLANLLQDTNELGLVSVFWSSSRSFSSETSASSLALCSSSKVCLQGPQHEVLEPEHLQYLQPEALEPDCLHKAHLVVPVPDLFFILKDKEEHNLPWDIWWPLFFCKELWDSSESVRTCWGQQARVHRVEVDSRTLIAFIAFMVLLLERESGDRLWPLSHSSIGGRTPPSPPLFFSSPCVPPPIVQRGDQLAKYYDAARRIEHPWEGYNVTDELNKE